MSVVSDLPLLNNTAVLLRATIVALLQRQRLCVLAGHMNIYICLHCMLLVCNNAHAVNFLGVYKRFKNWGACAKLTSKHTHKISQHRK